MPSSLFLGKREKYLLLLLLAFANSLLYILFQVRWGSGNLDWVIYLSHFLENKVKMSFRWDTINVFRQIFYFEVTFLKIHASHCIDDVFLRNIFLAYFGFSLRKILSLQNFHYLGSTVNRNLKFKFSLLMFTLTDVVLIFSESRPHFINFFNMLVNLLKR